MRFERCKKINNVNKNDIFSKLLEKWKTYLSKYSIEIIEPYFFNETQDNPHPKNFRDDIIFISRKSDFGAIFSLKNARHINFDFKIFLYHGDLYFHPGVYYFSHYIIDELYRLSNLILKFDDFNFKLQTYKEWADKQPDQKFVQHNYKIDVEDLAAILKIDLT